METNEFIPFEPVHPYDILKDELSARGIRQKDFASKIGMQSSNFSRMLKEKTDIAPTFALTLEKELGIPYSDWMYFQEKYLTDVKAVKQRNEEEAKAIAEESAMAERVNIKEIYRCLKLGLTDIVDRMKILKPYSSVIFNPDFQTNAGMFKKSELRKTDTKNLLAWIIITLIIMDKESNGMAYTPGGSDLAAIEIARLANSRKLNLENAKETLNRFGICFVKVEKLDKTPVDAFSTRIVNVPSIAVTCRINDIDKLAFDIIHELGHISLHMKDKNNSHFLNIDDGFKENSSIEEEADRYARDKLIPPSTWKAITSSGASAILPYKIVSIIGKNAENYQISPSIAVARYKHETQTYNVKMYRSPKII